MASFPEDQAMIIDHCCSSGFQRNLLQQEKEAGTLQAAIWYISSHRLP